MSLAPCHPALRARVSEAIAEVLGNHAHRALGRQTGHSGTTITERGSDLSAWKMLDYLLLAAEHDGLRESLIACLQGADAPRIGEATSAFGELLQMLERDATAQANVAAMLRDGRVAPAEARAAKQALLSRRLAEDRALIPALDACIGRMAKS